MIPTRQAAYRRVSIRVLTLSIGGVFAYAGQVKIGAAAEFAENIASFRLLPATLDNLLAISLPPFEILLGLLLIVGWRPRTTAFCAVLTSGIFLIALVTAGLRGIRVECGCFGTKEIALSVEEQLWLSIGRDLLLLGATVTVYVDAASRCRATS